jgi:hypothetical protein
VELRKRETFVARDRQWMNEKDEDTPMYSERCRTAIYSSDT